MKQKWNYLVSMWQPISMVLLGAIIAVALISFRLGSLLPGMNSYERATISQSQSLKIISINPIDAPYKTAVYLANKLDGLVLMRLVSVVIAVITAWAFYILVKNFTERIAAILGSLMFMSSSVFLVSARMISPHIMLFLLINMAAIFYYLRYNKNQFIPWLLAAIAIPVSLYTPGVLYFYVVLAFTQRRNILTAMKKPSRKVIFISGLLFLVLLLPLLIGLGRNTDLVREYLLIPASLPSVKDFALQLLAVPAGIIGLAPANPVFRLGRQPTLDAFAAIMALLGTIQVVKNRRLERLPLLTTIFVSGLFLTAISGNYEFSLVFLPFLYFVVSIGLDSFYGFWKKTFPTNPLARALAIILLTAGCLISINFQAWRYFVAFTHNDSVRQSYSLK